MVRTATAVTRMSRAARLSAAWLVLGASSAVRAQEQAPRDPDLDVGDPATRAPRAIAPVALVIDGSLGGGAGWDGRSALAGDLVARVRASGLVAGAVLGGGSSGEFLGEGEEDAYYGLLVGYRTRLTDRMEVELLGEGGRHDTRMHLGLFGGDPSPTTTLTYLGARAGADWRFGGHVRFVTGLWAVLRSDLSTKHVVAPVTRGGLFGPSSTESHDFGRVGGTSFALLLRVGMEIGFGGE